MNTQKFKSTHHLKVDALFKKALDKGKLTLNPFTRVDKKNRK